MSTRLRTTYRRLLSTPIGRLIALPYRASAPLRRIGRETLLAARWLATSREVANFTFPVTERSLRQLSHMVALVTGATPEQVRGYFEELSSDAELAAHVVAAQREHYPTISDPRVDFGRRLGWYAMVRITKPEVIVETGVDKGLGSVVLAAALLRNGTGRLYCTELHREQGKLLSGKYAEVGEILYGDSIETLQGFRQPIDLFINDSAHSEEYEYGEYLTIRDKLSPRAMIIADNAHVTDCAMRFSEESGRNFIFWREEAEGHWYPGAGIGLSYPPPA